MNTKELKKDIALFFEEAKPENFDFCHFYMSKKMKSNNGEGAELVKNVNECGTTFCLAGYLYTKDKLSTTDVGVISSLSITRESYNYCRDKYGMSEDQAALLFLPDVTKFDSKEESLIISPEENVSFIHFKEYVEELLNNKEFINNKYTDYGE